MERIRKGVTYTPLNICGKFAPIFNGLSTKPADSSRVCQGARRPVRHGQLAQYSSLSERASKHERAEALGALTRLQAANLPSARSTLLRCQLETRQTHGDSKKQRQEEARARPWHPSNSELPLVRRIPSRPAYACGIDVLVHLPEIVVRRRVREAGNTNAGFQNLEKFPSLRPRASNAQTSCQRQSGLRIL